MFYQLKIFWYIAHLSPMENPNGTDCRFLYTICVASHLEKTCMIWYICQTNINICGSVARARTKLNDKHERKITFATKCSMRRWNIIIELILRISDTFHGYYISLGIFGYNFAKPFATWLKNLQVIAYQK